MVRTGGESSSLPAEAGADGTAEEVVLIVANDFAMLQMDLANQPFAKSEHNQALREHFEREMRRGHSNYQRKSIITMPPSYSTASVSRSVEPYVSKRLMSRLSPRPSATYLRVPRTAHPPS